MKTRLSTIEASNVMDLDQPNELQPILEETMLRLAVVTMENERLVTQFTELKSENISLKTKA
jgi:chromosome segregation ATPase